VRQKPFTRFVSAVDEVNDHFGDAGKGDRACNSTWRSLYEGLMRMSMNTTSSGSTRVDDIQGHQQALFRSDNDIISHPQAEIRGLTKLVKITEDVRKFAAEQQISIEQASQIGLEQKAKEFTEESSEIYARG
jgi:hypothetical protein